MEAEATSDELVGPSPHGEGGLKYPYRHTEADRQGPSPHGEGGLK